jgi:hypothetical protein
MHLSKGNRWEGERGMGEWGGGQYTANWGPEWTGIRATTQRRDFQVSKGRFPRDRGRDSKQQKGDARKGFGACTSMYILC